ncbi:hypothetical protein HOU35_gp031 [Acinetobacter phage vB_AbaM_B09_Aci05]|uniref:Uncharacterized protein n=2 Tax=Saclayvirus TaxID=2733128 RepID=A0A386KNI8_9CAUD|nr:hypothetical protein HOU30_gp042 [Acinetobacter phage vB_AbaM_B09_Aci02-2]YP_009814000.1 hypothetical protein HOU35_gp031 [Acinetobacter phage vB_AbaM_B09_Aci05]AYD82438.1 hypothetical protein Aci05_146 [Acinetobacter phage vB_AbaM_B09_Aci05]AYD85817.1 hypothetical protein Aci022_148 [Acinetobacter phage vB_AbaM_B09_Aci02-2]UYL86201.1 putative DNA polymerase accessory protein clamp loader small subunit [Acinetobacter phage vB_AbaM_CP14]
MSHVRVGSVVKVSYIDSDQSYEAEILDINLDVDDKDYPIWVKLSVANVHGNDDFWLNSEMIDVDCIIQLSVSE